VADDALVVVAQVDGSHSPQPPNRLVGGPLDCGRDAMPGIITGARTGHPIRMVTKHASSRDVAKFKTELLSGCGDARHAPMHELCY
jgi:hypothetical protein